MKKIGFFKLFNIKIKKNFFNTSRDESVYNCRMFTENHATMDTEKRIREAEEYMNSYTTVTRWQTV